MKIGLFGTCRVSELDDNILIKKDEQRYTDDNKNEYITKSIHYSTSTTETLQCLKIIEDKNLINEIEDKEDFFYFTRNNGNIIIEEYDYYVFEICSLKHLDFISKNLRFPYKSKKNKLNTFIENEKIITENMKKINELCKNKPILIIPPIILENKLPSNMITVRKRLLDILKNEEKKYKNIEILDISSIINNVGFEKGMIDIYHFDKPLVTELTKNIVERINKYL